MLLLTLQYYCPCFIRLEDCFASIRIEQVDLVAINIQADFIASDYLRARIEGRDSVLTTGIEVDLKLVTQVLNHINNGIDGGWSRAVAIDKSCIFQMDRAYAEGKIFVASSTSAFREKWGNRNPTNAFEYDCSEIAIARNMCTRDEV